MKLLVLSGGRHPYAESTPVLGDFLRAAGHDAKSFSSPGFQQLVLNGVDWATAG